MGKVKFEKTPIGKVDQWLVDEAKEAGLDIDGFEHEITSHFVAHVMKEHGDEKKEKERGQVAIKQDDFDKIPDILKKPDITIIGAKREGKNMMLYAKEIRDGTTLYFEEILDGRKNKTLRSKTMFKRKEGFNREKVINVVTNKEKTDISKAKIVLGSGSQPGLERKPERAHHPAAATSAIPQDALNISQSGEKSSGFSAAETGNPPPLERRNFNSKENIMDDEKITPKYIDALPKDKWFNVNFPPYSEILIPSCFEKNTALGIADTWDGDGKKYLVTFNSKINKGDIITKGNTAVIKQLVKQAIKEFDQKQNYNFDFMNYIFRKGWKTASDFNDYIFVQVKDGKLVKQGRQPETHKQQEAVQTKQRPSSVSERENEAVKKAGYVQGVCECVAAMFGDKNMGKKLLSEMQVTKEMAKKYANPETYKILEQGIFAPDQEQKIEQQQSRGCGR